MKKKIVSIMLGLVIALQAGSAFAAAKNLIVDGQSVVIPEGMGSFKEQDDRTFAPVRFIAEYLGCTVKYNSLTMNGVVQESANIIEPNGEVILLVSGSDDLISFSADKTSARSLKMDTKVFIDNTEDRMYIPVRFFADELGYDVEWDEATETAILTKKTAAVTEPAEAVQE